MTDFIDLPIAAWKEDGKDRSVLWISDSNLSAPKHIIPVDDTLNADDAYNLACEGRALLWRSDFQNAKQLLHAMSRRIDKSLTKRKSTKNSPSPSETFHLHRLAQLQRARTLNSLLILVENDYKIPLSRSPSAAEAIREAHPDINRPFLISLRELLGLIGAHEWRKKGVKIPALNDFIYPHYGVFSPNRGEYIDLVANASIPSFDLAFDIGTGTGVLAAIMAKRGVRKIIATELDSRAISCASDNFCRLKIDHQIDLIQTDMFPAGKAPLVVCNPPWIPAKPSSSIEHAIYDPKSKMLWGFIEKLANHLTQEGEGWLLLSDLAEHLNLRTREELLFKIQNSGLRVVDRIDIKPNHPKSRDQSDPLYHARILEVTSLWKLRIAN